MDWLFFAAGSAFFAGITAILAKIGVRSIDSNVATAIRTIVVLAFSWLMVLIVGSQDQLTDIDGRTLLFLILSGLATGASWLCYFKALELGDVNKVVPIDKSSVVLTIVLALIFLGEGITAIGALGVAAIAVGTMLMIERRDVEAERRTGHTWLLFAVGSAVFAALTSILGKVGIEDVESNLGTAIRTIVVLIMSWVMVFVVRKQDQVRGLPRRELGFVIASGIATGASWLCFYRALQDGPASVVVPIDKLSILVTIAFAILVFHERLTSRSAVGLVLIVIGTLAMLVRSGLNILGGIVTERRPRFQEGVEGADTGVEHLDDGIDTLRGYCGRAIHQMPGEIADPFEPGDVEPFDILQEKELIVQAALEGPALHRPRIDLCAGDVISQRRACVVDRCEAGEPQGLRIPQNGEVVVVAVVVPHDVVDHDHHVEERMDAVDAVASASVEEMRTDRAAPVQGGGHHQASGLYHLDFLGADAGA